MKAKGATRPADQAPGTTRIVLKYPVVLDGLTCDHLDLRQPKARDLRRVAKTGGTAMEQQANLFASLTGMPPKLIAELDAADYLNLQGAVHVFLP